MGTKTAWLAEYNNERRPHAAHAGGKAAITKRPTVAFLTGHNGDPSDRVFRHNGDLSDQQLGSAVLIIVTILTQAYTVF